MIFQIVAEIHNNIIKVISSFIIYFCYPNTKQLAFDLESGIATISRDLDYMRDRMYAPIEYDYAQKGYHYAKPLEPEWLVKEWKKHAIGMAKMAEEI